MRVTTRFTFIALCTVVLAALPSNADDKPQAHMVGYRCTIVRDGATPVSTVMVCQIGEDADPFSRTHSPLGQPTTSPLTLDSLLNLLTTLDNARHEASRQRHDAVVPRPTP